MKFFLFILLVSNLVVSSALYKYQLYAPSGRITKYPLLKSSLPFPNNDTTNAIEFCIRYSVDSFHMPSVSTAMKKSKFGDSLLLTSEKLPLQYLPMKVDSMKFKIMDQNKLCRLLTTTFDFKSLPNYFLVKQFKREKDTYFIILESISCGRFPSGGGLSFDLKKDGNSFKIIHRQGFSIN